MNIARSSLETTKLERFTEANLYPLVHVLFATSARHGGYWHNHFSTSAWSG